MRIPPLMLIGALAGAGCARHAESTQVHHAVHASLASAEFARLRTADGPLCVQRTELPQWLYTRLYHWWTPERHQVINDERWWVRAMPYYLERQHELDLEDVPVHDAIGPLLPMSYVKLEMALVAANVLSLMHGLEPAYEIGGRSAGPAPGDVTDLRFRRTGSRGFRLPSPREWRDITPRRGHQRSDRYRCLHANLGDGQRCWDGFDHLAPVASYPPDRRGVYDLWGNAGEWLEPDGGLADPEGWWVGPVFPVGDAGYTTSAHRKPSEVWPVPLPLLGPGREEAVYGLGMRLVIEPDRAGRCPTLDVTWGGPFEPVPHDPDTSSRRGRAH